MKDGLKFKFSKKVFKPTGTSDLLYSGALKYCLDKKIKKSTKILDLGCGSGILSIILKENGGFLNNKNDKKQIIGFDHCENAI